jgi:thiamine-phosphate pyrophosphorylase
MAGSIFSRIKGKKRGKRMKREWLQVYAVTDRTWTTDTQTLEMQIAQALEGGVTMVQLREKHLGTAEFLEEAIRVKAMCHRYGVPLIINDNVDVALQSGADGVHVGADDAPVAEIRRRAGTDFLIGATAKTVAQATFAAASGADYLGVGAVFPSPTKQNAIRITPQQLSEICAAVSIPVVAIGGITLQNLSTIDRHAVAGVAVVSAIFGAADIRSAAQAFRRAWGGQTV